LIHSCLEAPRCDCGLQSVRNSKRISEHLENQRFSQLRRTKLSLVLRKKEKEKKEKTAV